MTVKLRRDKGVALTFDELDDNFADYVAHKGKFDIESIPDDWIGKILSWDGEKFVPLSTAEASDLQVTGKLDDLDSVTARGNETENDIVVGNVLPATGGLSLGNEDHPWGDLWIGGNTIRVGTYYIDGVRYTLNIGSNGDVLLLPEKMSIGEFLIDGSGDALQLPDGTTIGEPVPGNELITTTVMDDAIGEAIAALIDAAPGALDTLNELAASLADDPDFATTMTNALALKFNTADYSDYFDTNLATKTTNDLTEGTDNTVGQTYDETGSWDPEAPDYNPNYGAPNFDGINNLYFTDERARAALTVQSTDTTILDYDNETGIITYTRPTTDKIVEGNNNLYYTDQRALDIIGTNLVAGGDITITYNNQTGAILISTTAGTVGYDLSSNTTDDLAEGVTNLYFTTARADARIAAASIDDLKDVDISTPPADGQSIVWDAVNSKFIPGDSFNQQDFDEAVAGITTDDVAEGSTNVYYTQNRFLASLSGMTTDNLAEGVTNLYYTDGRVDDRIALNVGSNLDLTNQTTDDLTEGLTNLYYTTDRANTDFDDRLATKTTTDLTEGDNLYYTTDRANTDFDDRLATKTTTDLTEGTNLYYTDERVDDRVSNLIVAGDNITLTYDDVANTFTIAALEDNLSNNTTDDLAEGSNNLYYTDGRVRAAISVSGDMTYNSTTGVLGFALVDHDTTDLAEGTNKYFTNARVRDVLIADNIANDTDVANAEQRAKTYADNIQTVLQGNIDVVAADVVTNAEAIAAGVTETATKITAVQWEELFSQKDTDNIPEGDNNLYFTTQRARDSISVSGDLSYNSETGEISYTMTSHYTTDDFDDDFATKTTDNLTEGETNWYYTKARAQLDAKGALSASGDLTYNETTGQFSVTTYKTTNFNNDFGTMDTDLLNEGSNNLYYTDARVRAVLTADSIANTTYVDNAVSNLIDSSPDALNTLNELAAALGDDPNFATTMTNALATKANSADLHVVATTGSWNDLEDQPFIPYDLNEITDADGTIQSLRTKVQSETPTNPAVGDLWWNNDLAELFVFDGQTWVTTLDGAGDGLTHQQVFQKTYLATLLFS